MESLLHEMETYRSKKSIHWFTSRYRIKKAKRHLLF